LPGPSCADRAQYFPPPPPNKTAFFHFFPLHSPACTVPVLRFPLTSHVKLPVPSCAKTFSTTPPKRLFHDEAFVFREVRIPPPVSRHFFSSPTPYLSLMIIRPENLSRPSELKCRFRFPPSHDVNLQRGGKLFPPVVRCPFPYGPTTTPPQQRIFASRWSLVSSFFRSLRGTALSQSCHSWIRTCPVQALSTLRYFQQYSLLPSVDVPRPHGARRNLPSFP